MFQWTWYSARHLHLYCVSYRRPRIHAHAIMCMLALPVSLLTHVCTYARLHGWITSADHSATHTDITRWGREGGTSVRKGVPEDKHSPPSFIGGRSSSMISRASLCGNPEKWERSTYLRVLDAIISFVNVVKSGVAALRYVPTVVCIIIIRLRWVGESALAQTLVSATDGRATYAPALPPLTLLLVLLFCPLPLLVLSPLTSIFWFSSPLLLSTPQISGCNEVLFSPLSSQILWSVIFFSQLFLILWFFVPTTLQFYFHPL